MNAFAFEKYFPIRNPADYESDDLIKTGQSTSYGFDLPNARLNASHRLYFTGETRMFYMWKDEPDAMKMYQEIEDALNPEEAERSRFCLDLSMKHPAQYTKRAVYETEWPAKLSYLASHPHCDACKLGIYAKAEDLRLAPGDSCLRMVLEIWKKRAGNPDKLTNRKADKRYEIRIPEGSYPQQKLELPVEIPEDTTAYVAVTLEGRNYSGKLYLEAPFLSFPYHGEDLNVLPDFNTCGVENLFFDWMGMNLSKKEWPEFTIEINGSMIFDGELFERCHRYAEMEVAIPADLLKKTGNTVKFTLNSRYFGALPYAFREVAILEQPGGHPFEVIAIPQVANVRQEIPILIKTAKENMTVFFACPDGSLSAPVSQTFPHKGLNVCKLRAEKLCNNAKFTLSATDFEADCTIARMVDREEDQVITGTSDQVYISQNYDEVEEYLAWYCANHVGNFLTPRPIYRWGGARVLNKDAWAMQTRVMNRMGIKYAHMTEGRDLPGLEVNPSVEMLEGEHFLGRQMHEKDGQMFYWGTGLFGKSRRVDMYFNLAQRIFMEKPAYTDDTFRPENFFVADGTVAWNHAENIDGDMKKTGDDAVRKLALMRNGTPRHTGPSIMSKFFYDAGFDHFGAELMYGTMETNTAFLRGSAKAYGKGRYGAHHAMQWSSSPHDVPEKYRRYRLALYVSYLQGITDINTEEGLWRIEEYYSYFNRFSDTCKTYLKHQQDFARYVQGHTRRGTFYSPMAYIHGRYDGTVGFGHSVFGVKGMKECDAEKSWTDLLKLFYPLGKPGDSLYVHDCPPQPVGYHSGTPRGNVDAVPFEGSANVLPSYKALAFAGYNMATSKDMDRIYSYLSQGGTVILSWPHLSTTTNRADIEANRFTIIDHPLTRLMTQGAPEFATEDSIDFCTNLTAAWSVSHRTDNGLPLKAELAVDKGKLILFNAKAYPHNEAIRELYLQTVASVSDALIAQERSWIECGEDVEFAVYDREGCRDLYVLAVDWYHDPEKLRNFTLRIGENRYALTVKFGTMLKLAVCGHRAAFANCEDAEILFLDANTVRVFGMGNAITLTVADSGKLTSYPLHFGDNAATHITLE